MMREIMNAHLMMKLTNFMLGVKFLKSINKKILKTPPIYLFTAEVMVKVTDNVYVVEDERLEINCIVKGTNPIINWKFVQRK